MMATGYLEAHQDRKATCSHSRPQVSNANAFSESQFQTEKYQPDYPRRFRNGGHARAWCSDYFAWYNSAHHHSGLGGFTPEQVSTGTFRDVAIEKQRAFDAIYERHSERFVKGRRLIELPPSVVAINPVPLELEGTIEDRVDFPKLPLLREPAKNC